MLVQSLCVALGIAASGQPIEDALRAIRSGLPDGVTHLVYSYGDGPGRFELWIDPAEMTVLHIRGASAFLRDADGAYSRTDGTEVRTGTARPWRPEDPSHVQSVINIPHPLPQAIVLLAERDNITSAAPDSDGWLVTWEAPRYKVWRWDGTDSVEVEGASSIVFRVSSAGRVLEWTYFETLPDTREGQPYRHDYSDVVMIDSAAVPRYIDMSGKAQRPADVLRLLTAETLGAAPPDLFTRDGADASAAEAAKLIVQAYQERFYWHDSPRAPEQEKLPFVGPGGVPRGPSWSAAFITAGFVVLALGGFAWWRSKR